MKKITLIVSIFLSCASFAQNFAIVSGTPFTGTLDGSTHLVDIDADGDLDFFNSGDKGGTGFQGIAQLYTNDGKGQFTLVEGTPFPGIEGVSAEFADLDNDKDLDLILTGSISTGRIAHLYTNDGNGNFILVENTPFLEVSNGDVVIADLDNDKDLDVIISGFNTAADARIATVYKNDGTGTFNIFTNSPAFDLLDEGDVDAADLDGDGDLDLLVTGDTGPAELTSLFLNDGTGVFTKDLNASTLFIDLRDSDADIADIDGDGDKDILISGRFGTGADRIAHLYINEGAGTFVLASGTPFVGANACTVDFADFDNDGDMDVVISGFEQLVPNRRVRMYYNDGKGTFTEQTLESFTGLNNTDVAIGDVNGDNKKDLIINGNNETAAVLSQLYLNNTDLKTQNFNKERAIALYPNPTENYLQIDAKNATINSIEVIDSTGKLVNNLHILDNSIDISHLSKGVYIIKFALEGSSFPLTKKFIKQ